MAARIYGCLLAFACCCIAGAQTPTGQPAFALEIPGGSVHTATTYLTVADGGSSTFLDGSLQRLPKHDPNSPEPSALRLDYKVADGVVSITPTVFYGEYQFDHQSKQIWLDKLPHEVVGTYYGKLNERSRSPGWSESLYSR